MKKYGTTLVAVVASLAFPAAALAGNGNGGHNHHTDNRCMPHAVCSGGSTTPPTPPPAPVPTPPSDSTSSSTSNSSSSATASSTSVVYVNVSVSSPPVCGSCGGGSTTTPTPATHVPTRHCRVIHVAKYRKVWHCGRNRCGQLVRWFTYKTVRTTRRVCVTA